MKAIIYTKFGPPDVLHLAEVEKPIPKENELLIRVRAVSLNAFDWRHLRADPLFIRLMGAGFLNPRHQILGADVAGQVEAIGSSVKQFQPGDEVFGEVSYGGLAEYVCTNENRCVRKPANVTFEESAAVCMAGLTALQGLRDHGHVHAGQKVLVNGASGGVGSFAVQIAKSYGAEVTGVCSSTKMDFVRSIGVAHVVDYTQEDVTRNGQRYDIIFDTAAYRPIRDYRRIMSADGKYIVAGGSTARMIQLMILSLFGITTMELMGTKIIQQDLSILGELLSSHRIRSIIDKRFPLSEAGDAMRYLEDGHARGKVVISVGE